MCIIYVSFLWGRFSSRGVLSGRRHLGRRCVQRHRGRWRQRRLGGRPERRLRRRRAAGNRGVRRRQPLEQRRLLRRLHGGGRRLPLPCARRGVHPDRVRRLAHRSARSSATTTTPMADDGCSANCELEEGWVCLQPGVACTAAECGDGFVAGFEQCDDGNATTTTAVPRTACSKMGFKCDVPRLRLHAQRRAATECAKEPSSATMGTSHAVRRVRCRLQERAGLLWRNLSVRLRRRRDPSRQRRSL